jgi:hypothetical protein
MAVDDPDTSRRAEEYLKELIEVARMPSKTQVEIYDNGFSDALSQAPTADLSIFGLQRNNLDLAFVAKTAEAINASCIFVRDSGDESALA